MKSRFELDREKQGKKNACLDKILFNVLSKFKSEQHGPTLKEPSFQRRKSIERQNPMRWQLD